MKAVIPQTPFRFTAEADPNYCAKALCRARRKKTPTHRVTVDGVRGARVEKIAEVSGG